MHIESNKELSSRINPELISKQTQTPEKKAEASLENKDDKKNVGAFDVKLSDEAMKEISENQKSNKKLELEKIKNSMSLVHEDLESAIEIASSGLSMKSLDLLA